MGGNLGSYKPELSDVIRSIVDTVLLEMNVCLPGKIASYDKDTQYADVQIQLQSKFIDGKLITLPVVPNVPVKHARAMGGDAFIHMPLQVGDDVTLIFSQRSLDNWKTQGGITDPGDPRKFHITDAYALIGGSAIPDAFTPSTTDSIEIVNGQTQMVIHPTGKVEVKNDTAELIDLLDQITGQVESTNETLATDLVNTLMGPQPLVNFLTYEAIFNQLGLLKTKLESFKV